MSLTVPLTHAQARYDHKASRADSFCTHALQVERLFHFKCGFVMHNFSLHTRHSICCICGKHTSSVVWVQSHVGL